MNRRFLRIITMSTRLLVTVFAIPLLVLTGCSREKSDWRSAQAADTSESYEQFIASHPESTLITTARERLAQLAEEKDWRSAAEADTRDAYQQFLAQYPAGKWAKEAQTRIEAFNSMGGGAGAASATAGAAMPGDSAQSEPGSAGSALPQSAPNVAANPKAGFGVQLGAFSSAEHANEEWKKLAAAAPGTLDGLSPRVVVGDSGGKAIYRLQAEVRDEAQARAVCGGLKAAKLGCVVVLPQP
jgi:cell division septation protein DedD